MLVVNRQIGPNFVAAVGMGVEVAHLLAVAVGSAQS